MKNLVNSLLAGLFIFVAAGLSAQITTGTYTIGAGGDYTSIGAAVTQLTTAGVAGNGPVTFNIISGTYTEQITFGVVAGVSETSPVIFQSQSGNPNDVLWQHDGDFILRLNGCDFITFRNIKFYNYGTGTNTRIMYCNAASTDITFKKCRFFGRSATSTSNSASHFYIYSGGDMDNSVIDSCTFTDGTYPVNFYSSNSAITANFRFTNNTCNTSNGLYFYKCNSVKVINNTLNLTNSSVPLYLGTCNNDIEISRNNIYTNYSSVNYGIEISSCAASAVTPGLIANNFINVGGSESYDNLGIYLYSSTYQQVYYNTVFIRQGKNAGSAFYTQGGNNHTVKNNIFAHNQLGLAFVNNGTTILTSNYNVFYTAGNYLAIWGSNNYRDLTGWQANSQDANSLFAWPGFISATNLHIKGHWVNNKGISIPEVAVDFDGQARHGTSPDIGADEFTPTISGPYSGSKLIDAAGGGDFTSFQQAFDSLQLHGVDGSLIVDVTSGTYIGQATICPIPGASAENTIVFQSQSADSTAVSLNYAGTSVSDNWVLNISGADYITFRQLSINPNGTTYGRAVLIQGNAKNISFLNNVFNGSGSASDYDDRTVIFANNQITDNLVIQNNCFYNGSRHIRLVGYSTTENTTGLNISGNNMIGSRRNIYINNQTSFTIANNTLTNFTAYGIDVSYCVNPFSIYGNKLWSNQSGDDALYIDNCTGIAGGLIYNNFIYMTHSYSVYGIDLNTSQYQKIFYNSIRVVGTNSLNAAFYNWNGSYNKVKNNILVVEGNGYCYYNNKTDAITESDYNDLYSTGNYIGYWGSTNAQNLEAFRNLNLMDAHSISVNPVFTSTTNMHTNSYFIDNLGTPLAEVNKDIDGELRSTSTPDMGADEFTSAYVPLSGTYTIGASGDYTTISAAVADLAAKGILGTTIFNILPGSYNEYFSISPVTGATVTDTVVFQSQTGNPNDVVIDYSGHTSTQNYIVLLDGADFITIRNLKFQSGSSQYSHIIVLTGNAQNINITGNIFEGRITPSTYNDDAVIYASDGEPIVNNLNISNNIINNGSFGILLVSNTTSYSQNLKIKNNNINSYSQGMYINYFTAPLIQGNTVQFSQTDGYGIGLNIQNCVSSGTSQLRIIANKIISNQNTSQYGGIFIRYCDATSSRPGQIYNNIIRLSSSGKNRTYGFNITDSDYLNIYHNSVNITGNNQDDAAFYSTISNYLNIQNNIFAIRGEMSQENGQGYAYYVNSGTISSSDFNDYYSPGRYLAYWAGTACQSLAALKTANSKDANSVSFFPAFFSLNNLKTNSSWVNAKGTPIPSITTDIDGNPRDPSTPDPGAYEYSTTLSPIPSGTYNLGAGLIPSFDSLPNMLMRNGIGGKVTINIPNGIYMSVHFMLKPFPKTSSTDTLFIQSLSGNASQVTIGYTQDVNNNYIIDLNGADDILFRNLSFSSGGTSYTRIITMSGNVKNIGFRNCIFSGLTSNTSGDVNKASVFLVGDKIYDNLLIKNCQFLYNSYGIQLNGMTGYSNQDIRIEGNYFNTPNTGVYMNKISNAIISGNEFNNAYSYSVYGYYCIDGNKVLNNYIHTNAESTYAIYFYTTDGTALNPGLIANNFVQAGITGTSDYGIKLDYCTNFKIYYNTVSIYGASALHIYAGSSNIIMNNILQNKRNSYAYNVYQAGNVVLSNYNDLYSAGTTFAYYNGSAVASLAAWQTATGKDANSVSIEPVFASLTDLHLMNENLMGLGFPLAEITTDIDGHPRDANTPDIGADELYCTPAVFNQQNLTACMYETITFTNLTTGTAAGTVFFWDVNGDNVTDFTTNSAAETVNYGYSQAGQVTVKLTADQLGGCLDNTTFTVTVKQRPNPPVSDNVTVCTGSAIPPLEATGSNIKWYSDAELTNQVATGNTFNTGQTQPGTYTYYATQMVDGCTSAADQAQLFIISSPEPPVANSVSVCYGQPCPTLTATGQNIKWYSDPGLTNLLFSSDQYNPGVTAVGVYTYYVTQSATICQSTATIVTLTIRPTPVASGVVTNIDCQGNNYGSINLTVNNGTFPYFYLWSNGKTSEDIGMLAAGSYSVTVQDINGCSDIEQFNVTAPDPMVLNMITNDAECQQNNGSATVSVTGGQTPYTYLWSNGETAAMIDSLYSGIYIVTVTDHAGCMATSVATINDLGGATIALNAVQHVSCYGLSDGAISLTITGGNPPYAISWSNGATTEDINGLQAGPYEIIVIDSDSCRSAKSIVVTQPQPISILMTLIESNCGQATGNATATVTGGTSPYSYAWSNGGANNNQISNLTAGVYKLTVTDAQSCQAEKTFAISEIGAPSVVVDSILQGTCGNSDGAIYISVYGSAVEYTYLWSNQSTNQDLTGVLPGTYAVTVSDASNCHAVQVATINANQPPVQSICLVTVDSATNFNQVVWEKPLSVVADHYNIYRETTQSGSYQLIGSVDQEQLSIFTDEASNAQQRSYRYKMTAVDECGVESEQSAHHKTMHLTINLGLNNTINLIWDHYEGFNFSTYYIYRFSNNQWNILETISNNLTSFTDLTPPTGLKHYAIEVQHPQGCIATKGVNKNTSRSNVSSTMAGGVGITATNREIEQVNIYPNPSNGTFNLTVKLSAPRSVSIELFNIRGGKVWAVNAAPAMQIQHEISPGQLPAGIYYVRIIAGNSAMIKPVIVE